ncbi:MAG: hypothetical protein ACRYGI_18770 [Janthinobacterium lividum]
MNNVIIPAYFSVKDAVSYSGLTRTRLFDFLSRGILSARKAGRQTLVERLSIDNLMASLPQWTGNAVA